MQFKKKKKVFCPTICIHSAFIIVFPVCLNLKADRMNKPYRRSFLFLSRAPPPQKKIYFFWIFRYKQSHSGDDAEMNTVAECIIITPNALEWGGGGLQREGRGQGGLAGDKEGEGYEARDTVDGGGARTGRVGDL